MTTISKTAAILVILAMSSGLGGYTRQVTKQQAAETFESVWRLPYTMTEDWETLEEVGTETEKFKANGFVRYSDFGARGDGKTDDIDAIAATHAYANQEGLPVKADDDATYYISGKDRTAVIQTDTDFGTARFIIENLHIDDSNHPADYQGPAIFANFNRNMTDASYVEEFPYVLTREVVLKNVTTASGKTLRVSDNPFMFKDVELTTD